jgi:hypothetical protein
MPDGHRPATPQIPAVDDQFGTHRVTPRGGLITENANNLKRRLAINDVNPFHKLAPVMTLLRRPA